MCNYTIICVSCFKVFFRLNFSVEGRIVIGRFVDVVLVSYLILVGARS